MPNGLYAMTGVKSAEQADGSGLSWLPIRPALCQPGGLRVAALGLAAEHGAAMFAFKDVTALPLTITVSQGHIPVSLSELEIATWMRHRGRSVLITGMDAFAAGNRRDRLAFGTITWSVVQPTPPPPRSRRDQPQWDLSGDLASVAGVVIDNGRVVIPAIPPGALGPGGVLHAGALQALSEEAALEVVRQSGAAARNVRVCDATFHFIRAARQGPFVARLRAMNGTEAVRDVDIEVVEDNGNGKVCAICVARVVVR